ncbi:hypothetical protein JF540_15130 [Salipiger thiooxidans]|nr:hypothetical protein [Salipiger thiooxidans]MBN8188024.1 hypothetical protein [Salipiger thiooxidans]
MTRTPGLSGSSLPGSMSCRSPTPVSTIADACRSFAGRASAARSSRPRPPAIRRGWCCSIPAHLHEEEARRHNLNGHRGGRHAALYDTVDALDRFGRVASCGNSLRLFPGMTATFFDAGQILGPASIRLELRENGQQRRILISGDLGPSDRPLLNDPAPPDDADIVVMDTTYGDRDHRDLETLIAEFGSALRHTARRGNVELTPASVRVECQCMVGLRSVVIGLRCGRPIS